MLVREIVRFRGIESDVDVGDKRCRAVREEEGNHLSG
jgi:hypothetical protein